MIVDSSVLVAIVRREPEAAVYVDALAAAGSRLVSAASYLECGIVLDRMQDSRIGRALDRLLAIASITVAPVTHAQAVIARAAYRDFGKGCGHPAGLNFGDCFAYSLAIERDEPLLYKGGDFGHTDVIAAIRDQSG